MTDHGSTDPDEALRVAAEAFRRREAQWAREIADLKALVQFYAERLGSEERLCAAYSRELAELRRRE